MIDSAIIFSVCAVSIFISLDLIHWSDGRVIFGAGQYAGAAFFPVVNADLDYANTLLTSSCDESYTCLDVVSLTTHFALCAGSEDDFNELVLENFGYGHDCTGHAEWELVVDGCRDYQEAHYVAYCAVCGADVSEEMAFFDDREPEHDDYEEGF